MGAGKFSVVKVRVTIRVKVGLGLGLEVSEKRTLNGTELSQIGRASCRERV